MRNDGLPEQRSAVTVFRKISAAFLSFFSSSIQHSMNAVNKDILTYPQWVHFALFPSSIKWAHIVLLFRFIKADELALVTDGAFSDILERGWSRVMILLNHLTI
jgi:hypothetical protein